MKCIEFSARFGNSGNGEPPSYEYRHSVPVWLSLECIFPNAFLFGVFAILRKDYQSFYSKEASMLDGNTPQPNTNNFCSFAGDEPIWTALVLRVAAGGQHHPGMCSPVKAGVKDKAAFESSLATIIGWDFDRVIVGRGDKMSTAMKRAREKKRGAVISSLASRSRSSRERA